MTVALAKLLPGSKVYGLEKDPDLVSLAVINCRRHHGNLLDSQAVTFAEGDGRSRVQDSGPFDVIHVGAECGSGPPQTLLDALAPEGILVAPVRREMCVYVRVKGKNTFRVHQTGILVGFVPLV
jgi:protein-L-isoaspartate O-methyltransferase